MLDVILSYFPKFNNHEYRIKLKKICDFTCDPIRKILPPSLAFDISPMIVILILSVFIEIFNLLW